MNILVQIFTPGNTFPKTAVVGLDRHDRTEHVAIAKSAIMSAMRHFDLDYTFDPASITQQTVTEGADDDEGQIIVADPAGDTIYLTILDDFDVIR